MVDQLRHIQVQQRRNTIRVLGLVLTVLVLSITSLLWPEYVAHADGSDSTLTGRLINRSKDHGLVADIPVFLHRVENESTRSFEVNTDSDGRFVFEDVAFVSEAVYGITTMYQGAFYAVEFIPTQWPPSPVEVIVYDSAEDDSFLSLDSMSILFEGVDTDAGIISVMEMVTLSNPSDLTYIPGPGVMDLLRFGLPEGALGFRIETGLVSVDHIQVDRGFALVGAVPPGQHELLYSYRFPYAGSSIDFDKKLRYGSNRTRVLVPIGVMKVTSEAFAMTGRFTIGSVVYEVLELKNLPRGTTFSIQLSDLPVNSRFLDWFNGIRLEYAALVSLSLLMASIFVTVMWSHAKKENY